MNKFEIAMIYREIFKNYIKVLLDIKRGKQDIKVIFRNDRHEEILSRNKVLGILQVIENSKYLYLTQLRYKLKLESRKGVGDWRSVFSRRI
ncbi:MAG: hypothetical protein RXR51_04220 [Nitrososphaeria archaeon]